MARWRIEISHSGLNKSRVFTGNDKSAVEQKAREQQRVWAKEWLAAVRTAEAKASFQALRTFLVSSLTVRRAIDWHALKNVDPFSEPPPTSPELPETPVEPQPTDFKFTWLERVFNSKVQREQQLGERLEHARDEWQKHKTRVDQAREAHEAEVAAWRERSDNFIEAEKTSNKLIDDAATNYANAKSRYLERDLAWTGQFLGHMVLYDYIYQVRKSHKILPMSARLVSPLRAVYLL